MHGPLFFPLIVFFQLEKLNKLFQCSNGAFIRKDHVCNGITECADGSDEKSCDNGESVVVPTFRPIRKTLY